MKAWSQLTQTGPQWVSNAHPRGPLPSPLSSQTWPIWGRHTQGLPLDIPIFFRPSTGSQNLSSRGALSELAHKSAAPCPQRTITTEGKRKACRVFQEYLLSITGQYCVCWTASPYDILKQRVYHQEKEVMPMKHKIWWALKMFIKKKGSGETNQYNHRGKAIGWFNQTELAAPGGGRGRYRMGAQRGFKVFHKVLEAKLDGREMGLLILSLYLMFIIPFKTIYINIYIYIWQCLFKHVSMYKYITHIHMTCIYI